MSQQSTATTTDTRIVDVETARTAAIRDHLALGHSVTVPASEVRPGQHIWHLNEVREVRHVEPYRSSRDSGPYVLIVMAGADVYACQADMPITLASKSDIAAAQLTARRAATADGLRALADLITDGTIPLDHYFPLSQQVDPDSLRQAAETLGLPVEQSGGHLAVTWQSGEPRGEFQQAAVQLRLIARPRPVPPGGDRP